MSIVGNAEVALAAFFPQHCFAVRTKVSTEPGQPDFLDRCIRAKAFQKEPPRQCRGALRRLAKAFKTKPLPRLWMAALARWNPGWYLLAVLEWKP